MMEDIAKMQRAMLNEAKRILSEGIGEDTLKAVEELRKIEKRYSHSMFNDKQYAKTLQKLGFYQIGRGATRVVYIFGQDFSQAPFVLKFARFMVPVTDPTTMKKVLAPEREMRKHNFSGILANKNEYTDKEELIPTPVTAAEDFRWLLCQKVNLFDSPEDMIAAFFPSLNNYASQELIIGQYKDNKAEKALQLILNFAVKAKEFNPELLNEIDGGGSDLTTIKPTKYDLIAQRLSKKVSEDPELLRTMAVHISRVPELQKILAKRIGGDIEKLKISDLADIVEALRENPEVAVKMINTIQQHMSKMKVGDINKSSDVTELSKLEDKEDESVSGDRKVKRMVSGTEYTQDAINHIFQPEDKTSTVVKEFQKHTRLLRSNPNFKKLLGFVLKHHVPPAEVRNDNIGYTLDKEGNKVMKLLDPSMQQNSMDVAYKEE